MDTFEQLFLDTLSAQGITLNERQLDQFALYHRELVSWNEKMNLTGITEREPVYWKHFYDSLSLAFFVDLPKTGSLADIGSGAGFPSIPLKIAFPHLQVTIVDSLNKRIQFLNHVSETLGLEGVQALHGRAEDLGRRDQLRDQFDLVTARAVARLQVLNEFCLPFVRKDGMFVAMKGADPQEELTDAAFSLRELNAKLLDVKRLELPHEQGERHILLIAKTGKTPGKYPRAAGIPLKKPLA